MSFRYGMLALLGAGLSFSTPARAQVMADIRVGPRPIEGRVIVGAPHVVVGEPVLVRRPVTYLLPVEDLRPRHPKWYHRKGWRPVTVWFDGRRFIHPASTWRPYYREVLVLERGGRYGISGPIVGRSHERYWHDGGGRYEPYDDHRRGDRDWQRKRDRDRERWNDDDRDWED
ncbi:MAG TPA: hypothetical protein VFY20_07030 [Gemmatimonadales bacterium]|nr:hypothetical protein [Gemmatimonadales bacterium]